MPTHCVATVFSVRIGDVLHAHFIQRYLVEVVSHADTVWKPLFVSCDSVLSHNQML